MDIEAASSRGGDESPSTENSPLLPEDSSHSGVSSVGSGASTRSGTGNEAELWDELNKPWPSTFERSIHLLASPRLPKADVAYFTKSPKPGSTQLALARRSNLDRGYYTPDTGIQPPKRGSENDFLRIGARQKVQSLDFSKRLDVIGSIQAQQKKAQEAKAYRAEILKQQGAAAKTGKDDEKEKTKREKTKKVKGGKASFAQCTFNLANILMGVGLLGLPFVFRSAGWAGGFLCIFVFSVIAWRTSILIGRELNGDPRPSSFFDDSPFKTPLPPGSSANARMLPPITSFPDIARNAFGETGCFILSFVLYFELFSCIGIFFVAIGDHLHELFPVLSSDVHSIITALVSLLPTVILRTPALLSYLSMVGTFATICLVLAVISSALVEGDITDRVAQKMGMDGSTEPYHVLFDGSGLVLALGLVAYCFSGHAIVPSIYTSMERPQDFERMVTMTFVVVTIACLAVAVSGYYMFGSLVQDQVTLSLQANSSAATAMKALTWLMIMTGT